LREFILFSSGEEDASLQPAHAADNENDSLSRLENEHRILEVLHFLSKRKSSETSLERELFGFGVSIVSWALGYEPGLSSLDLDVFLEGMHNEFSLLVETPSG
jgi:hypothetical protein